MIKAVIYDLDDTLFPEDAFQRSGRRFVAEYISSRGFPVSKRDVDTIYAEHPRTCFNELIKIYKLPMDVRELITIFREHIPTIEVYPGIKEILGELKKKYRLGIFTDYYQTVQKHKIQALGIEGYFKHILYTESMGTSKPDVAPFEKMKQLMNCKEKEIVYVGDNEQKDFIGAHRAGYYTVKYASGGVYKDQNVEPEYRAQFEIRDHKEIFAILEKLSAD